VLSEHIANDVNVRGAWSEIERVADPRGFDRRAAKEFLHGRDVVEPLQHEAFWSPLAEDSTPEFAFDAAEKCRFNQAPRREARAVGEIIRRLQDWGAQEEPHFLFAVPNRLEPHSSACDAALTGTVSGSHAAFRPGIPSTPGTHGIRFYRRTAGGFGQPVDGYR